MIDTALAIAIEAFRGQVDKGGRPKVLHSLRVGLALAEHGPELQAAGFLHDVLEDSSLTAEALRRRGLPWIVVATVAGVTRRADETYREFIERVRLGPVEAIRVKLADLADNLARAGEIPDLAERTRLWKRYDWARRHLSDELHDRP